MRFCYYRIFQVLVLSTCLFALWGCAAMEEFFARNLGQQGANGQEPTAVTDQPATATDTKPPAQEEPPAVVVRPPTPKSDVHEILAYFQYLQELPANELALEYRQARRAFEKNSSNYDRFRLICMSILPDQRFTDRAYALKLINDFERTSPRAKADLTRLASLLKLLLMQQQDLHKELLSEREKADVLARQLKELKDIEKILSERELKGLNGK